MAERTETYPRDRRGYQTGPDLITALGVMGTGVALALLVGQDIFTLGRSESCDLRIVDPRVDVRYLAGVHARLERIQNALANLRVVDISSGKNDIVFRGEASEREFVMGAGDWFEIGDTRYFAQNEEMRLARPKVAEILGIRDHHAIDELMIAAVQDSSRPMLLEGEPGTDQERLGRVIHQISHRRHNRFHPFSAEAKFDAAARDALRDARDGTVLVELHRKGALDPRFVEALVDPEHKLRLIIAARTSAKAEASFPVALMNNVKKITIAPLRERTDEIGELLDKWLIARRSNLRYSKLPEPVRDALQAYHWRGNLQELRESADNFAVLAHYRSIHQAIQDSELTRATLRTWMKRLNLKIKLPLLPPDKELDKKKG